MTDIGERRLPSSFGRVESATGRMRAEIERLTIDNIYLNEDVKKWMALAESQNLLIQTLLARAARFEPMPDAG